MTTPPPLLNFHEVELMTLLSSLLPSSGIQEFYKEWKFVVLAIGFALIAALFLWWWFAKRNALKYLATARLTKCSVTSSRKKILVTIHYQYNIGQDCYQAFEKIIRYPQKNKESYRDITKEVMSAFTVDPVLEVFGRSSFHLKSHSVQSSIRRRVPELAKAHFGG
jgi:hypothetical protein